MKNKGGIITLIILLMIIVLFLVFFLVACLNGSLGSTNLPMDLGTKSSNIIFDEKYKMREINDIEILAKAGDIKFQKTLEEDIRVVVYGENSEDIEVTLNENKLKVDYTNYTNNNQFLFFKFGSVKNDIIVYMPATYSNSVKIVNNYGNCEIEDLENATIDIDCDCGNVELGKVKNAKIKCDYGNVEIDTVLNKCDIKSDCGNVEIEKLEIKENSSIRSDLGNIEIEEINDIYVEADVDLGKANINKNNRNSEITLTIKCDCGNVTIEE